MLYLLDTNVISGLMRKRPEIRGRLASLAPSHDVVTCPIVRGEILFGIEKLPDGRRRQELAALATFVLADVPCESVPETAGDAYSQIKATRQRRCSRQPNARSPAFRGSSRRSPTKSATTPFERRSSTSTISAAAAISSPNTRAWSSGMLSWSRFHSQRPRTSSG